MIKNIVQCLLCKKLTDTLKVWIKNVNREQINTGEGCIEGNFRRVSKFELVKSNFGGGMDTTIISADNRRTIEVPAGFLGITIFSKLSSKSCIKKFDLSIILWMIRGGKSMRNVHGGSDDTKKMIIKMRSIISNKAFISTVKENKSVNEEFSDGFSSAIR